MRVFTSGSRYPNPRRYVPDDGVLKTIYYDNAWCIVEFAHNGYRVRDSIRFVRDVSGGLPKMDSIVQVYNEYKVELKKKNKH